MQGRPKYSMWYGIGVNQPKSTTYKYNLTSEQLEQAAANNKTIRCKQGQSQARRKIPVTLPVIKSFADEAEGTK